MKWTKPSVVVLFFCCAMFFMAWGWWTDFWERDAMKLSRLFRSEPTTQTELAEKKPTDDDLSRAVLGQLNLPSRSATFPVPDEILDADEKELQRLRQWSATLSDKRVQRAYNDWLDYYQHRINENRRENITHERAISFQKYLRESKEERDRVSEIAPSIPKPPSKRELP